MNAQWEDEVLKESEYLEEDLNTETSSEDKRYQCFKTDILCIFACEQNEEGQFANIITKNERDIQNLNFVLKEYGTAEAHSTTHVQLGESDAFQKIAKSESRKGFGL